MDEVCLYLVNKSNLSSFIFRTAIVSDNVFICYSDEHGDRPRPLPDVPEMKGAKDLTERKESPHWDFDVRSVPQHILLFFIL